LLRNFRLSDDIAFRFSHKAWSEWPLTADKFVTWINDFDKNQPIINIFADYETFGEHQWEETGIFEFLKELPYKILQKSNFGFNTPSQIGDLYQPVAPIHVPYPASWADEERDLTAWLGNELQDEAFNSLYRLVDKVKKCTDPGLKKDWLYLQSSDHFYYMCTKWFSDGEVHKYFNPYPSPYEAFINFMNVLSDFMIRLDKHLEETGGGQEELLEEASELMDKNLELAVKTGKAVAKKASELGRRIKQSLDMDQDNKLSFEDIGRFSDTQLKKLLKDVDTKTLFEAFKDATEEFEEKILPNLTQKARKEMETLKASAIKITKKEISKSKAAVLAQLAKLTK
jgi:alpha-amylase